MHWSSHTACKFNLKLKGTERVFERRKWRGRSVKNGNRWRNQFESEQCVVPILFDCYCIVGNLNETKKCRSQTGYDRLIRNVMKLSYFYQTFRTVCPSLLIELNISKIIEWIRALLFKKHSLFILVFLSVTKNRIVIFRDDLKLY